MVLAQSIAPLSHLQHLDIRHNRIDTEGAVALAQSLTCLSQLQHLDIGTKIIDPEGDIAQQVKAKQSARDIPQVVEAARSSMQKLTHRRRIVNTPSRAT